MSQKSIYLLPLSSLLLVLNGCSSSFGTHAYNDNYGLVENSAVEKQLQEEIIASDKELENFTILSNNMEKFIPEEGTFLAEDWVKPEPIIEYKYMDDPKFYGEDELPQNKARLGNVVLKIPKSMSQEKFLTHLPSGSFSY